MDMLVNTSAWIAVVTFCGVVWLVTLMAALSLRAIVCYRTRMEHDERTKVQQMHSGSSDGSTREIIIFGDATSSKPHGLDLNVH